MDVINVGLYGGKGIFGGRETPLEASVISCDKYKECSFFESGNCLNVRAPFKGGCKHGKVQTVKGYTSRAKKYGEFRRKWAGHDQYNELRSPTTKLGVIDGEVIFPYPYIRLKQNEYGDWVTTSMSFGSNVVYIDLEDFTPDLIRTICTCKPQAMMGGEITEYQKKTVPLILSHIKEVLPKKYDEFINEYPEYMGEEINYIGRKALLSTVKESLVHYKSSNYPKFNEEWNWDGEYLTYVSGYVSTFNVTKDYDVVEITIKPKENATIIISSNEQVKGNTVFLD